MLGLLRRLWEMLVGRRLDLYRPRERTIFHYFDGTKIVRADPLVLYKELMAVGAELDIDIKLANSQHKDAQQGQDSAIETINRVFGLKPLDQEGGVTGIETMGVYDAFWEFCEGVKKKSRTTPTSVSATSPTTRPTSAAGPATSNGSASGSTASAPSTVPPTPLPTEQPLPSEPSTQDSVITGQTPMEREKPC